MDDLLDTVAITLVVNVERLSCGGIVHDNWGWGDGKVVLLSVSALHESWPWWEGGGRLCYRIG